jgi:hypothetical protein
VSSSDEYPTKPSTGDLAHWIAKMGLAAIPAFGGTAVEVFQFLIQSPLERRRDTFVQQLGEKFLELEARGIKWENLQQDEQFISVVLHATQAALRTHQLEKLAALRNAITNAAQDQSLDDTLLHVLLSHIDTLSAMHLRILKALQDPTFPAQWDMNGDEMHGVWEIVVHNIPELQESEITPQLLVDLNGRGLIDTALNMGIPSKQLSRQLFITSLGKRLIRLITD